MIHSTGTSCEHGAHRRTFSRIGFARPSTRPDLRCRDDVLPRHAGREKSVHEALQRRSLTFVAAAALSLATALSLVPTAAAASPAYEGLQFHSQSVNARLFLLTQLRDDVSDTDSTVAHAPIVRMARPMLRLGAFDDALELTLQAEIAGKARLMDMIVRARLSSNWSLSAGQMIAPYTRQFMTPAPRRQMIDFGLIFDRFNLNRRVGAMVSGDLTDNVQLQFCVFDPGDVSGGVPGSAADHTARPMAVGRLTWAPLDVMAYDQVPGLGGDQSWRMALSLGGALRQIALPATASSRRADEIRGNLEVAIAGKGLSATAEAFVEQRAPNAGRGTLAWGGYAQAGWFVVAQSVEAVGRFGIGSNDSRASTASLRSTEAGANWYLHEHHAKLGLRWRRDELGAAMSASSTASTSDTLSLQLQGWL